MTFEVDDIVPADCRLVEVLNLEVDEALLTGEAMPSMKSTVEGPKDVTLHLGDRTNMVYSRQGRGKGFIVETVMATEIGKIMQAIQETPTTCTPLQRKLNWMAYVLLGISIVLAVNKFHFTTEIAIYAIALSIVVIPEGLIAVITIMQALDVRHMTKQHALVRKLVGWSRCKP